MMKRFLIMVFAFCGLFFGGLVSADSINTGDFVTTWRTTTVGESITIPTNGGGYNYNLDCDGDGYLTGALDHTGVTGDGTCTFDIAGDHSVRISADFPRIYFNNKGDKLKLIEINQWGDIEWKNMSRAFFGASNMDVVATDIPDLSQVEDMSYMFSNCSSLVGNDSIYDWDTNNVTNMASMFYGASSFNQNIGNWTTTSVEDMSRVFFNAKNFDQNLNNWDVSNVTTMLSMFNGAQKFNQPLNNWNTTNVTKMNGMFGRAHLFNQDISNFDTSNVTDMDHMFYDAKVFNNGGNALLMSGSNWNTKNVTNMNGMFQAASNFNQDISNWNTENVINMKEMFKNARVFDNGGKSLLTSGSSWNVSNVTIMHSMFANAYEFNQDISNWNVSNVTNMQSMFESVTSFNQDISDWNVGNVTNMQNMFVKATSFDQDLSLWNFSSVARATSFLNSATSYSVVNYDKLLSSWYDNYSGNNLSMYNREVYYCTAKNDRTKLNNNGWYIKDGGLDCEPTIVITAPTKLSSGSITDTTIRVTDLAGVNSGDVSISSTTTASTSNFSCTQDGEKAVNCTVSVDDSGDLTISMINTHGQKKSVTEQNYVIDMTPPSVPSVTVDTSVEENKPTITFSALDNVGVDHYTVTYTASGGILTTTGILKKITSPLVLNLDPDELETGGKYHEITVTVYDKAGNSSSTVVRFPPIITFVTPTLISSGTITDAQVIISSPAGNPLTGIVLADAGTTNSTGLVNCIGSGGVLTASGYASPVTCDIAGITGSGTIKIVAQDTVTDAVGQNFQSFVIDKIPPVVQSFYFDKKKSNTSFTGKIVISDDISIKTGGIVLTGEGITLYHETCEQVNNQRVECSVQIDREEGVLSSGDIKVIATDVAGNTTTRTDTGYLVDPIAPVVEIKTGTMISSGNLTDTTITITDNYGIETGNIYSVGSATSTLVCTADSTTPDKKITCTADISTSGDLEIEAFDDLGNKGTGMVVGYVVDRIAPVLTIDTGTIVASVNESSYPLQGTCTAGDLDVNIVIGSGTSNEITTTVACSSAGKYAINVDLSAFDDGSIDVDVSQLDSVGNKGTNHDALTKSSASPVITLTPSGDQTVTVNNPISSVVVSGNSLNTGLTISVDESTLPTGVVWSGTTSTISGTPTVVGTYSIEITVKDNLGNQAERILKITVNAVSSSSSSSSHHGGGGSTVRKDSCPNGDNSPSYYDGTCGEKIDSSDKPQNDEGNEGENQNDEGEKTELESAYEYAKRLGITTMPTFESFNYTGVLLRKDMAKMMTVFMIKELGETKQVMGNECKNYQDISNFSQEYKMYIELSCRLGIMGLNGTQDNVLSEFNPNREVTRAEFGTVLSRVLRGKKYAQTADSTWYGNHLEALKSDEIMKKIDQPWNKELRGWVIVMLQRVSEEDY